MVGGGSKDVWAPVRGGGRDQHNMRRSVPETRVLVVDADASSLEMLAVALLDSGFAVRTAASGAEALAEARKRPPSLVLTEIAMPGMDGIQLCAAFRGDPGLGNVPIVLLAGGHADP